MAIELTINGIALLVGFVALAVTGMTCYIWGRSDGKEARR